MPIYEYQCTNADCGHELEALQKISDERLVFCPSCGEASLKKKISAAGFRLKGTGWYETDFKSKGKNKGNGKGKSDGADSGAASSSEADKGGKPETPKPAGGSTEAA